MGSNGMKQKDILLIIIVIFVSTIISMVVSKIFISAPKNRQQTVEVVPVISAKFDTPDKTYFNDKSIDATLLITIGNNTNPQPFNSH